jgi:hypothetical protein
MKKKLTLGAFVVSAVSIGVASVAFACQSLATLAVSPTSGPVGTLVTFNGGKYSRSETASNVEIHRDTKTGPILWSGRASATGTISGQFNMTGSVGYHVLIATQYTSPGVPCAGCPGRSSFKVTGTSSSSASMLPSALTSPVGLAGVGLLTALGAAGALRRRREVAELG